MQITGHLTESVYRRYAIVAERDVAEGLSKLARVHEADSQKPGVVVALAGEMAKGKTKIRSRATRIAR
jgi:hypothetical protein